MADGITLNSGSGGATLATDDVAGTHYQIVKVAFGALDTATLASTADPLPVSDAGGSLTVDNAALSVTGGGVEASALRVTLASDSTGVVSVDDNGSTLSVDDGAGSLTVDNAALSVTGGGVEASALRVTLASDSTGVVSVDDNGASLTIDNAALSVTGGGVEASALRVTLASDSTGVLSVDDNGGALTVDNGGTFAVQAAQSGTWNVGTVTTVSAVTAISNALPAGTNNIGDVDVLTQPARAATTDTITAKLATDALQDGTTALTPKFAAIDAATLGDNTLVAAVTGKKIRVVSAFLVAAGTVNARFESGAAGTALTGQMNLVANTGFVLPFNPVGWFETASATLLNLELSAAVSVDGSLTYVEV